MMERPEQLKHDCVKHDEDYPNNKMSCNPNTILCSDCPFTKEELKQRWLKKYPKGDLYHGLF
jgi:hypothetical protein